LHERLALVLLLLATFALRAARPDQPIVENYVGRQIPTAMVARNLDRGAGVSRPQLDTGPFPNLFLVEPPAYALAAVGLRRALPGSTPEAAGRLVSALATALGAWGLFGLVRRREGPAVALAAVASFALLPVTIRYGRAFQPDAAMLGTQLAALRLWDEANAGAGWPRRAAGWVLLATSLALKVTTAYVLVPLIVVLWRPRRARNSALVLAALAPALAWYAHAAVLLGRGSGSRAPADSGAIWLGVLVPTALLRGATYVDLSRSLLVRAFTPLGLPLAAWGWWQTRAGRSAVGRLGRRDGGGPGAFGGQAPSRVLLVDAGASRLGRHRHRARRLVPAGRAGAGRGRRGGRGPGAAGGRAIGLDLADPGRVGLPARGGRGRPPARGAGGVGRRPRAAALRRRPARVSPGADPAGAVRAAGEWGGSLADASAVELVEFYRARGARYFADVRPEPADPRRRALHAAIRRYRILDDRPGVLLAELSRPEEDPHADR
jgi:hypothetical protein